MLGFIFLIFGSFASAHNLYDVDMDEYYAEDWRDPEYAIDGNLSTCSVLRDLNNGEWIYLNTTYRTVYVYGVRVYVDIANLGGVDINFTIQYYDDDGSRYEDYYFGYLNDNAWTYINVSPNDALLCSAKDWRLTTDELDSRGYVQLREFGLIHCTDSSPSVGFSGVCDYNVPEGSVYGLYQTINFTYKESDIIHDNASCELWMKGINNNTWYMIRRDDAVGGAACFDYDGSYFGRYGVTYTYAINLTDDFNTPCQGNWNNNSYSFTIIPKPLDEEDDYNSLPQVTGLTDWDCWEMFSVCGNVSIWDLLVYNVSDSSYSSWNDSVADGDIYNGMFWWNSSSQTYDNVTELGYNEFGMMQGYWFYSYNDSCWLIHNCSCPDIDESMSDLNNIFNLSLDNESWVNVRWDSWFNDSNPDTLETVLSIVSQYINNSVGSGSGSGWVSPYPFILSLSDSNISCNVSVTANNTGSLLNSSVNESGWLNIASFSLSTELTFVLFIGLFFWFASERKSAFLFMLCGIVSFVTGIYYIILETSVSYTIIAVSIIGFSIYSMFLAFVHYKNP